MIRRALQSEAVWQLFDQAAVSGGNFLTTLILARTLLPEIYGTFSILFLSLFAVNACHSSLVVYPLTLDTATAKPSRVGGIAGEGMVRTLALLPFHGLVLVGTTLFVHRFNLFPLLLASMLMWQMQETARRTLLANKRSLAAFLPDALSYLGQGLLILWIRPSSLAAVFAVVMATSMAAGAIQFLLLKISFESSLDHAHFRRSWGLGRFTLGGNVLSMVTLQLPSWALEVFAGSKAVAGLQALINPVGIANPIMYGVSNLLIPAIARSSMQNRVAAKNTMYRYGALFASLIVPCSIILLVAPHLAMSIVYGKSSPYLSLAPWLRLLAINILCDYASVVIGAYEGGSGRPETYMFVQIVGATVLIAAGVPLIRLYGIQGAVLSLLAASVARVSSFALISRAKDSRTMGYTLVPASQLPEEGL